MWKYVKILSIIGIGLASYLFTEFILKPQTQICTINNTINCDAVTKGTISTFFGIPVPLIGLIGYLIILISAVYKRSQLALFMAAFGTLFCLRITVIEIFFLKVICPVCLACQLVMLALLVILIVINTKKRSETQTIV
jgi:uncharacterized membrane protein